MYVWYAFSFYITIFFLFINFVFCSVIKGGMVQIAVFLQFYHLLQNGQSGFNQLRSMFQIMQNKPEN